MISQEIALCFFEGTHVLLHNNPINSSSVALSTMTTGDAGKNKFNQAMPREEVKANHNNQHVSISVMVYT